MYSSCLTLSRCSRYNCIIVAYKINGIDSTVASVCVTIKPCEVDTLNLAVHMHKRGPNLFFKYFYFLFGPGLLYPLRVLAKVQILFGSFVGTLAGALRG